MAGDIAGDTMLVLGLVTEASPVLLCAVAASVGGQYTLKHKVIPAMALEAPDGFLSDFLNMCPVVANGEPVGYSPVGSVSISKR